MKELIQNYIQQNNSLSDFINRMSDLYQDGNEVVPTFVEKLKEANYNAALGSSFAELLQLSDNNEIYSQFELSEISTLYQSLIQLQQSDIGLYIDAGYFEFSVMDDSVKAKEIAKAGLEIAKLKVNQLETLLSEIDKK